MNRLTSLSLAVVLLVMPTVLRAEAPQADEAGFPSFAAAQLSIAKMGVFLDQNGAFANRVSPNIGPLAKIALANALFKLPVDESLNFEGQAQIFFIAPITLGANQETATILPVSNAEKLKKNIISIFGDPVDQNGALSFTVPQPLPLPDKALLLKIVGNKALLAPNPEVLKQLEAVAAAPAVAGETADATLTISMPAIQKLYGHQLDSAMQAGAMLAAESVEGLKKVSEQLDLISKTVWQIGTIELRLNFDKDSKNVSGELALVPLKDSRLAELLSNPPPGLDGKNSLLLVLGSPLNAAVRMNGKAVHETLKKFGIKAPETTEGLDLAVLDMLDGETTLAFDSPRLTVMLAQRCSDPAASIKKVEALQQAVVETVAAAMKVAGTVPNGTVYAPIVDSIPNKKAPITVRKIGSHEGAGKLNPMVHDENGYLAHTVVKDQWVMGLGMKPEDSIAKWLEASSDGTRVLPELQAAFDAPPPGTLAFFSVQPLEVASMFSGDFLGENVTPDQIVGGLSDAPISISVFAQSGKAGVRGTLPGSTAGSIYIALARMRRHGINIADMLGLNGRKSDENVKAPGGIPAPPPEK